MDTSSATLERPRPHPACACPASAMHSAWDLALCAPCAVGPHDPACHLWDARCAADGAEQDAAGAAPELWLG
ncbi:MAG: hypothetical protein WD080_08895 [Egibacteraceae bacterium]